MRYAMIAAALLLASCGEPESALQPGRWTGTVEFDTSALPKDMPVLAPASATIDKCLTKEQAQQPADFLIGGRDSCDRTGVKVENGRIEGSVRCPPELGGTSHVSGQYSRTSYQLTITTGGMTGRSKVDRVGECNAG